jgi:hypothetical protein
MYTQQEYEADVEHWTQHRSRLLALFLEGQTPEGQKNPRRLDGLKYKQEDDRLQKLLDACELKLRFSKFQFAQKQKDRKAKQDSTPTRSNKSKRAGSWKAVTADQALTFKQTGHDVRCTGVKTWEVFV